MKQITATVTKEDVANAGRFDSNSGCLIATLAKRVFKKAKAVSAGLCSVEIDSVWYSIDPYAGCDALCAKDSDAKRAPFYYKHVIGKSFTFSRI